MPQMAPHKQKESMAAGGGGGGGCVREGNGEVGGRERWGIRDRM